MSTRNLDTVLARPTLAQSAVLIAFGTTLALAIYRLSQLWTFTIDDAFITARYARNLARGYGPVYNPGESPVEGTSNFLYVLLLSLAELCGLDMMTFAKVIGVASAGAILVLTYRCVRRLGGDAAVALTAATFLLANASFLFWTVGGLETHLYALLVLCPVFLLLSGDDPRTWVWAGVSAGLAAITRFDGLFMAPAMLTGAALFRSRRRALVFALTAFLLVVFPCLLWKSAYYGSVFPNCGFAKTRFQLDVTHPLVTLWALYSSPERRWLFRFLDTNAALVLLFAVYGCASLMERSRSGGFFFVVAALFVAFTMVGFLNVHSWMPGFRYYVPLLPLLSIGAAVGLARLTSLRSGAPSGVATTAFVVVLLLVLGPQIGFGRGLLAYANRYRTWLQEDHEPTGLWIRAHAAPGAVIGLNDAGLVPYLAERTTIDLGGLNDRTIAMRMKDNVASGAAAYVLDRKPAFLILAPPFPLDIALASEARFRREYRLLFVSGRPDSRAAEYHLFVYARVSEPAA